MRFLRLSIPVFAFLAAWEVVSRSGAVSPVLFPPPSRVFATLFSLTATGQLITDALASYRRLIVGLSFGSAIGVLVGLFTGRVKRIADALVPLIQMFRPLPPVAIIPLIIVWFGIGEPAKYFSLAFAEIEVRCVSCGIAVDCSGPTGRAGTFVHDGVRLGVDGFVGGDRIRDPHFTACIQD